jgi:YebC/PmpR family DNA-binding regulatory protein
MGEHPAPQGQGRQGQVQAVLEALQGNHHRRQDGRRRSRHERPPAPGREQRQGGVDAKGHIQRAIDKGAGADGAAYEYIRYEGFAPGGVGLIIECSTDNRNRAANDVRATLTKNGGTFGQSGSVSSGFENVGEIVYPVEAGSEDQIMEAALDAGASDVVSDADGHYIYTARGDLMEVAAGLEGRIKTAPSSTNLIWKPLNTVAVSGENADTLMHMLELLDDLDDVQNVYGNYELSEAEMARLAG